jgi:hypothetical protein
MCPLLHCPEGGGSGGVALIASRASNILDTELLDDGMASMLKRCLLAALAALLFFPAHGAHASPVVCGDGNDACVLPSGGATISDAYETSFFTGLQWNFGDRQPELVLGVRRAQTTTERHVRGAKIDLAIPLLADLGQIKPVVRVMGLAGSRDVQGEFGFGLRLLDWKPVAGAGLQIPYANGGLNYVLDDGIKPYAGFNTLKRAVAPRESGGVLSCPTGYVLASESLFVFGVAASAVVDGQTCTFGR